MSASPAVRKEHRYADDLFRIACARDLIASGIYPNMKEWTEAAACYEAVSRHICSTPGFSLRDRDVRLIAVGDGSTPRVAAMFARRSAWECISVDPMLKQLNRRIYIERLTLMSCRIEDAEFDAADRPTVLVACHSHVDLQAARMTIRSSRVGVVAMPCCIEQTLDRDPDTQYADWGCWSPERWVKVWKPEPPPSGREKSLVGPLVVHPTGQRT